MVKNFAYCYLALILIMFSSFSCSSRNDSERTPTKAVAGIMDLADWDFEEDGLIDLSGDYEFYWMQHVHPDSFGTSSPPGKSGFINVPDTWNNKTFDGQTLSGDGYATYRLIIHLRKELPLAFRFLDMASAFKVFANGEVILSSGVPGKTPETSQPKYFPIVVDFLPKTNQVEFIFWVSNYHHRLGGAWEPIQLGLEKDIRHAKTSRLLLDIFVLSSILVMGLYQIWLFALRSKNKPSLYFGLFCILISLRTLAIDERHLVYLFPNVGWEFLVKFEYLSYYLALPTFAMFLHSLYREDFSKLLLRMIQICSATFCLIVIFTPVRVFSYTAPVHHIYTIVSCLYGIYLLVLGVIRDREGAKTIFIGFLVLSLAIVNDILKYFQVLPTVNILPFGLLGFIFSMTALIAYRFSKTFEMVELQRHDLSLTNEKYRKELVERKRVEKDREDLQEKLVRAEKMQTLGVLAGGVAHDLNNILSGIVTYPDFLLTDIPEKSELREPLETIRDSGLRAAAVVQDLLALARRGVMNFEVLNLNNLLSDYLRSPEHRRLEFEHPGIDIETELEPNLFNIKGSPHHLKKTVLNLVANTAEAQPLGGHITISTTNLYIDKPLNGYEMIDEGTYVVVKIEDRGTGINPDDLKKIFEPFYTKKNMGRSGTGLGMAVVWGTIHDHHGYIDVDSTQNEGTVFKLYFQVTQEECLRETSSLSLEAYQGNKESILIIDDVMEQRQIASKILKRLDYTVATVASGEEAVEYVKNNSVDLLLLDMMLGSGIDGLETFEKIVEIQPDVKAIIASGFSQTERVKQAQGLGAGSYIKKPYTLEKIASVVRVELGGNDGKT